MGSSKIVSLDRDIQYQVSTVKSEHSWYETIFENANEITMIEQERRLLIIEMSEILSTKTEPVDNESIAFQSINMALMYLKKQLSIKECDMLMQSMLETRVFIPISSLLNITK